MNEEAKREGKNAKNKEESEGRERRACLILVPAIWPALLPPSKPSTSCTISLLQNEINIPLGNNAIGISDVIGVIKTKYFNNSIISS